MNLTLIALSRFLKVLLLRTKGRKIHFAKMKTEESLINTIETPKLVKLNWDLVKDYGRLVIAYYNRPPVSEERLVAAISEVSQLPVEEARLLKKNGNIHDLIFDYRNVDTENYSQSLDQFVELSGNNVEAVEIRSNIDRYINKGSTLADLYLDKLSNFALRGIELAEVTHTA